MLHGRSGDFLTETCYSQDWGRLWVFVLRRIHERDGTAVVVFVWIAIEHLKQPCQCGQRSIV